MAKLISKTYGDALFEVAAEEDKLENHLEEVEAVLDVLKENEEYIKIIGYPRIPVEEKKAMIESAFKDKGSLSWCCNLGCTFHLVRLPDILRPFPDRSRGLR